jgi:hypothetical protein
VQLVLTVTESFSLAKRGVLILPTVPLSRFAKIKIPRLVELRSPDGSVKVVAASFTIPRVTPPPTEHKFLCMLPSQDLASVPVGTEVWAELVAEQQ